MFRAPHRPAPVNLSCKGRRLRLGFGVAGLVIVGGASILLILSDVDRSWRIGLFLPYFLSLLCLLEGISRTCVILAALGAWDVGCGPQRIPDAGLEYILKKRARKLIAISSATGAIFTLGAFLA